MMMQLAVLSKNEFVCIGLFHHLLFYLLPQSSIFCDNADNVNNAAVGADKNMNRMHRYVMHRLLYCFEFYILDYNGNATPKLKICSKVSIVSQFSTVIV